MTQYRMYGKDAFIGQFAAESLAGDHNRASGIGEKMGREDGNRKVRQQSQQKRK